MIKYSRGYIAVYRPKSNNGILNVYALTPCVRPLQDIVEEGYLCYFLFFELTFRPAPTFS